MVIQSGAAQDDEYDFAIMCFMVGPHGRARFAALWKEQVKLNNSVRFGEPLIIGGWPGEIICNPAPEPIRTKAPEPARQDLIVIEHRGSRPNSHAGRVWWHLASAANEFLSQLKTDSSLIWSAVALAAAMTWLLLFGLDGAALAAGARTPGLLVMAKALMWMPVWLSVLSGAFMYASILAELNFVSENFRTGWLD